MYIKLLVKIVLFILSVILLANIIEKIITYVENKITSYKLAKEIVTNYDISCEELEYVVKCAKSEVQEIQEKYKEKYKDSYGLPEEELNRILQERDIEITKVLEKHKYKFDQKYKRGA